MTNQEIIQALKENTSAFGLMPVELQEKARKIGGKEFETWLLDHWKTRGGDSFSTDFTYRLRPDYQEEPERIELKIGEEPNDGGHIVVFTEDMESYEVYTNAPALFPKEGYGFIGFRYNLPAPNEIRPEPVMYINKFGSVCRAWIEGCKVVKPIAAVYQKEAQCS
jgi:hypothetical protein